MFELTALTPSVNCNDLLHYHHPQICDSWRAFLDCSAQCSWCAPVLVIKGQRGPDLSTEHCHFSAEIVRPILDGGRAFVETIVSEGSLVDDAYADAALEGVETASPFPVDGNAVTDCVFCLDIRWRLLLHD